MEKELPALTAESSWQYGTACYLFYSRAIEYRK